MNRNVLGRLMRDAEAIVALYREGVSLADLGIRWNCHSNTMKRFLTSQDVVLRRSRPRRELNQAEITRLLHEGWDAQEVARMFNVRTETLAEYLVEKCGVITSKHDRHRR